MDTQPTLRDTTRATAGPRRRLSRRRWLQLALGAGAASALGGGVYAYLSSRLEVTHARRAVGLPSGERVRVAAVSDLHLCGKAEDYAPLLEEIRAAGPDLLVAVGDTVDRPASLPLVKIFSEIEAPLGRLATLGNWEYEVGDLPRLRHLYDRVGVRLLVNEIVSLPHLSLVGLDDWVHGRPRPELAVEAASRGPALVLSHCPVTFDHMVGKVPPAKGRSLTVLSGHTHGGQIAPFGLALYTPAGSGRYLSGWYEEGGAGLYVLRGVGYSYVRIRLGPRPELLVLDLV